MSIIQHVNVFQGTGKSTTPKENTLFSKWNLLKGKAGNLSPSACLPFGNVACSPYSGGYSSGYGAFMCNYGQVPERFFEGDKLIGFSHFTHSGSGAFGFYYNYLLTIPYRGDLGAIHTFKEIDGEKATAGYYACRFKQEDIACEVTVNKGVALHRYTGNSPFKIAVDISNNGLMQPFDEGVFSYSDESEIRIEDNRVVGYVVMQGIKLYYAVECNGKPTLWVDKKQARDSVLRLQKTDKTFGCTFDVDANTALVKVAFSLVSEERALAKLLSVYDFDAVKQCAQKQWEEKLSVIQIDGVSEEEKEVFYSNFYHSLIKPCAWQNESFLWDERETFYLDFATLWDVYKTQMPLIFALYPETGKGIVKTILRYAKTQGKLFNALMLSSNQNIESTQACCLACYVLYDAYTYGLIEQNQMDDIFDAVKAEVGQYRDQIMDGTFEKTTKLLDCTLICASFAGLAKELERKQDQAYFAEIAEQWTNAFGDDGLLKTGYPYYEGNHYNYSFRFVHDREKRIELAGGKQNLLKQLDKFFAFDETSKTQNRFEGFNNETDMETPYVYHYVGDYEKLCTIIDECVESCFQTGREGIPGNGDSGGLTACYLWNFLGLFPQSGMDKVFVGKPKAKKAKIRLGNSNTLTIINDGAKIPKQITFNGEKITDEIAVKDLLKGGVLQFWA
ncbi:MAG: glycoside hydrolase family 92 protein [Clostridia bacterium]|nr:glycoside hydrolase family 92 protein [Clostridia bacterium]